MSMLLGFSSNRDKTRRKSCHRRNDSSELGVFDAEGYFSSIKENLGHDNAPTTLFHELGIAIRDDCNSSSSTSNRQGWREGRVSLDIPATRYTESHHYHHHHHHHHHYHRQHSVSHQPQVTTTSSVAKEMIKKHKQPSSPGGKLASFFNSLISQAVSKKKKSSKLSSQQDGVTEEESPSSWRRRKSSNFTSSNTSTTSNSTRTRTTNTQSPPYPLNTPTKSYKDLSQLSVSRCKNSTTTQVSKDPLNLDWLDEKFKCIEKKGFDHKERSWASRNSTSEESGGGFKRFTEDDGESDSSSDLFELQLNYKCSSGLPVYETTCMDNIKRSSATPITNVN